MLGMALNWIASRIQILHEQKHKLQKWLCCKKWDDFFFKEIQLYDRCGATGQKNFFEKSGDLAQF